MISESERPFSDPVQVMEQFVGVLAFEHAAQIRRKWAETDNSLVVGLGEIAKCSLNIQSALDL